MNVTIPTSNGEERRYGINQHRVYAVFLPGGAHRRRPTLRERYERGEPLLVYGVKRDDAALAKIEAVLSAHDNKEAGRGYVPRVQRRHRRISIDFAGSKTCADIVFLLLADGALTHEEVAGFFALPAAHSLPTYTRIYCLSKWALLPDSHLAAAGGIAFSGGGHYLFVRPDGEQPVYHYHWQPQLQHGYGVEFSPRGSLLLKIDG